mgnify:CR=1 FL=1
MNELTAFLKTRKKANLTITWSKISGVKGYQIQVATDKKFKKNKKTVTIKKQKTTKKTIKKLKDYGVHIHPSMENAFSSMYGYTSDEDGIRHGGIDFKWAPAEDAKYMLVSCSAFVNYLIEKWSKAAKNQDNSEV